MNVRDVILERMSEELMRKQGSLVDNKCIDNHDGAAYLDVTGAIWRTQASIDIGICAGMIFKWEW